MCTTSAFSLSDSRKPPFYSAYPDIYSTLKSFLFGGSRVIYLRLLCVIVRNLFQCLKLHGLRLGASELTGLLFSGISCRRCWGRWLVGLRSSYHYHSLWPLSKLQLLLHSCCGQKGGPEKQFSLTVAVLFLITDLQHIGKRQLRLTVTAEYVGIFIQNKLVYWSEAFIPSTPWVEETGESPSPINSSGLHLKIYVLRNHKFKYISSICVIQANKKSFWK